MKKGRLLLLVIMLCCFITAKPTDVYWDFNNDNDLSTGFGRNGRHEIISDNLTSSAPRIETFTFDNPDCFDLYFNIRFRDGHDVIKKERFFLQDYATSPFGVVWDYVDANNYCAVTMQRQSSNHYDELTRDDLFIVTAYKIEDGHKTILQQSKIRESVAFESHKYNSFSIKTANGKLSVLVGHQKLKQIYVCDYQIKGRFVAGTIVSSGSRLSIKRVQFKDYPDNRRTNMTHYTQEDIDRIISENTSDPYVGYWRYLDRITDDKLFMLGGKYTIIILPDGNGNYEVLYNSGANIYTRYWQPFMKKGMLESTPFFNHYDLHWYSADKKYFFDESYASLSEGILTMYFPIQKSSIRFYHITSPSNNP